MSQLIQLQKELFEAKLNLPTEIENIKVIVQSGRKEDEQAIREALQRTYEIVRNYLQRYGLKYVLPREVRVSGELDGPSQMLYTSKGVFELPFLPQALGAYTEHRGDDQDVLYLHRAYLEGGTDVQRYTEAYEKASRLCKEISENPSESYRTRVDAAKLYQSYRRVLASIKDTKTEEILTHELGHSILVALGIFSPLDQILREQEGDPTAQAHVVTEEGLDTLFTEQILGREVVKEDHPYYKPKKFVRGILLENYGTEDVGKLVSDAYNMGVNACKSFGRELRKKTREKLFERVQEQAYGAYP